LKPKTLITASCAACLLVLLTPGVILQDEPWAAGRPAPVPHAPGSGPRLRHGLQGEPVPADGDGRADRSDRADRAESESQLASLDELEDGGR
jgi:hypothetical protein